MKDQIHKAERKAVPGLIGMAGPSGSGKTFSALLFAAGVCPEGKRIGLIDTEKGRGEHYADNPTIKQNLPEGYDVLQIDEPYSPDRYHQAIEAFVQKGNYGVIIIDSATHEWEGFGGCQDIAENNKLGGTPNWAMAKKEHKRFMRKALTAPFTTIFCLRAQEKTLFNKVGGKMVFTDLGMQPVQEKNFKFEMLIACMLDPVTKFPIVDSDFHKVPDELRNLFQPGRFITKQDGINLRTWISGGKEIDTELRALEGEFRSISNDGLNALMKFWKSLNKAQKLSLEPIKDECKQIASEADRQSSEVESEEESTEVKPLEKAPITPQGDKNEKQPAPQKEAVKKDPEPKAEPAEEPKAKPAPTKKPSPNPTPTKEEVQQEEIVPPVEEDDEATKNAKEIAAALSAEADGDDEEDLVEVVEAPKKEAAPKPKPTPTPAPVEEIEDDEELDLF